jgi:hypothetical protein
MVIRRVGVVSAGRIAGALYAVIGLITGCIVAMVSLLSANLAGTADGDMPSWLGPLFGVGAIVVAPILDGVMGLVIGALAAAIYNIVAGMAGGLEVDVQ